MLQENLQSFVSEFRRTLTTTNIDKVILKSILEKHNIPKLSSELLKQSGKCKAHLIILIELSGTWQRLSAHNMCTRSLYLCLCPKIGTLVLKTVTCYEYRTHGHHFREQCYSGYQILGHEEFIEIVLKNKNNEESVSEP